MATSNSTATVMGAKDVVNAFLKALNEEDFTKARQYASDAISFVGVLGTRQGADAYFADMERMRLKYDIKKIVAEGNDVCVMYDIKMGGVTVFSSGWYQVQDGKIQSFRVVFDPRPVLEQTPKK